MQKTVWRQGRQQVNPLSSRVGTVDPFDKRRASTSFDRLRRASSDDVSNVTQLSPHTQLFETILPPSHFHEKKST